MSRKIKTLFFLIVLALQTSSHAFETEHDPSKRKGSAPLFPIHYGDGWGFVNRDGRVVIPPKFATVGSFSGGLAWVTVFRDGQRKVGYVNELGKFVIEPQFDEPSFGEAGDFLDELAPVRIERKWGYVDRVARWVVPPTFQAAGEFHEGLARVELWDQYPPSGTPVFTKETAPGRVFPLLKDTWRRQIDFPGRYLEGRFGFIDKLGRMVIQPRPYDMIEDFSCGFAVFRRIDKKWGYIDRRGNPALDKFFDYAQSFSEGLACVTVNERSGFIDRSGRFVVPLQYGPSTGYSEGIAVVTDPIIDDEEGSWRVGGIDKTGNVVVPFEFHDISDFSEGLAVANSGRENFFIDRQGRRVSVTNLPLGWWGFRDGLAIVGEAGTRVYVDRNGKVVTLFEKNPS